MTKVKGFNGDKIRGVGLWLFGTLEARVVFGRTVPPESGGRPSRPRAPILIPSGPTRAPLHPILNPASHHRPPSSPQAVGVTLQQPPMLSRTGAGTTQDWKLKESIGGTTLFRVLISVQGKKLNTLETSFAYFSPNIIIVKKNTWLLNQPDSTEYD